MASVFELSKTRTGHKRDIVEEELRKQIDEFEDKLKVTNRELELFMKKEEFSKPDGHNHAIKT